MATKRADVEEAKARVQSAAEARQHDVDLDALAMKVARAHTLARAATIIGEQYEGKLQSCALIPPKRHEVEAIRRELEYAFGPSRASSSIALAK